MSICYDRRVPGDWSVYIARCRDGSLYTGVAKDVLARLTAHNSGKGAAYTRSRRPVRLVYREDGLSRSAALSREAGIKSLERRQKLSLLRAARGLLGTALLLAAGAAGAVPAFDKEDPVLLSSAAPQAFTGDYPALRMYFLRRSSGTEIGTALSADGVSWTEDAPAGRLSTTTLPSVSASSITGCGVLALSGGGFRMAYSILSATGAYRVHTATSADGLAWANEARPAVDNAATPLSSPKLAKLGDGSWRLYFLSGASSQVFTARSTDEGVTWGAPSLALSTSALQLAPSVLTDGKVRLYLALPLAGVSSGAVVASALSSDSAGSSFSMESGLRLSTSASSGTLSDPVPVRSTDSFRWRLYYSFYEPGNLSTGAVHSALTGAPAPASMTPSVVENITAVVSFTILGDVFSLAPTAVLSLAGQPDITPVSVTRADDQTINASFNVLGREPGLWSLTVTNADGTPATRANALKIDFPGGSLSTVGNLLRPRTGATTAITATIFNPGRVTLRVYTMDGRLVRTLHDADHAAGTVAAAWDGRDASGVPVASGLYVLHARGPKLDVKGKIVVIR